MSSPDPEDGRLTPERRRKQTRECLLRAAAQVFAARGFHGASLDEVAAVAGFTKGAVYSNFKNKEDLFLAVLEQRYEEEMENVRAVLRSTEERPETHLSDFVSLIGGQFEHGGEELWAALYQEFCLYALRNPVARHNLAAFSELEVRNIAEILSTERARHGVETTEPVEHDARIVSALMRGLTMMRNIDSAVIDESFLNTLISFLARGLRET